MTLIKYFSLLILSFFLTFSLTFFIYYNDIKSEILEDFTQQSKNVEVYLNEFIKNNIKDNNYKTIGTSINSFISMDIVKRLQIEYKRYVFSKQALLLNSNKINSSKYSLSDVTTDVRLGKIVSLDDTTYEFIPDILFNINDDVIVKFQAFSDNEVFSSTSTLKFGEILIEKKSIEDKQINSLLSFFVNFDSFKAQRSFSIPYENEPFVEVSYLLDKSQIDTQMESIVKKIFIYSISIFFITIVILYFFYLKIVKKDIEKPIGKIQSYVDDILNNQFIRLEKIDTKLMHIDEIFSKLKLLSKKVASLTNETNINKELLAKKDFTDEITGLPNKKVFEKDIKNMFISNSDGYIMLWKIDKLGDFVAKNGTNDGNNLLKDFGHGLVQLLKRYPKYNSNVYRFYGAEFAIIMQINSLEQLQNILKVMTENIEKTLKSRYLIEGKLFHCGVTPFDQYGTMDSILHNAHETYLKSFQDQNSLFLISDNAELIEKTREYERTVKDIIKREDFTIKFIFDTFEMDEDKLIMQDASPLIIDNTTFEKFPIGVFISVAEKLKMSSEFDKIVIKKVLSYLEFEKLVHKIVINLSIQSLTDRKFLSWLEGQLLYNNIAKENLIFSITSYNAKENFVKFKSLIEVIHKFESKVMLKRFSLDDFSLEELDTIEVDYIRLNKEYCQGIDHNRVNKHAVKKIILYGEMNDIFILGDSIKADEDYKTMSRLGLYATSR